MPKCVVPLCIFNQIFKALANKLQHVLFWMTNAELYTLALSFANTYSVFTLKCASRITDLK